MNIKDLYHTLDSEYAGKRVLINGLYMTWKEAIEDYGDYRVIVLSPVIITGIVYFKILCMR